MPNDNDTDLELDRGREIFRTLRLAGCGFTMNDEGRIGTSGATPDPELLAQANANYLALGFAIAEVTALEGLLRRRLGEGSAGTSIARAILEKDPTNDFAIMALREAPDSAGAIFDCLQGMGLILARSNDDPEKVSITGPAETLRTACGSLMQTAIAQHRLSLLAKIDQAAVEATQAETGMATAPIRQNPESNLHAIMVLNAASGSGLGIRQNAAGQFEIYGDDAERVERFAFDMRDGLPAEQMQILATLLDQIPLEPRLRCTYWPFALDATTE